MFLACGGFMSKEQRDWPKIIACMGGAVAVLVMWVAFKPQSAIEAAVNTGKAAVAGTVVTYILVFIVLWVMNIFVSRRR
jgi:hypothetical protein